jgi:Domain of unknown function (DUF4276)
MKKLIIICEGQTEVEFVKKSIRPYLQQNGIEIIKPISLNGLSRGSYQKIKNDAIKFLSQSTKDIVTTFIDFYKLPTDFPNYDIAMANFQIDSKILNLESALSEFVDHPNFIPYIQLHEFEALLFSNINGFKYLSLDKRKIIEIENIINEFSNPELINNGIFTAPAKRLKKIIPEYNKPTFGNIIAQANGFSVILEKCPRFNYWIKKLIERMKET